MNEQNESDQTFSSNFPYAALENAQTFLESRKCTKWLDEYKNLDLKLMSLTQMKKEPFHRKGYSAEE